jgi:hypothetical protein
MLQTFHGKRSRTRTGGGIFASLARDPCQYSFCGNPACWKRGDDFLENQLDVAIFAAQGVDKEN